MENRLSEINNLCFERNKKYHKFYQKFVKYTAVKIAVYSHINVMCFFVFARITGTDKRRASTTEPLDFRVSYQVGVYSDFSRL